MLVSISDILYKIGQFFGEYTYYAIIVIVVIMLIISFCLGLHYQRKERKAIEDELKKSEINAPKSKKNYVQGAGLKTQKLSIDDEENKDE